MSAAFVHGPLLAGLLAVLLVGCERRRAEPAPTASASASTEAPPRRRRLHGPVCPWCFIGTERLDHAVASSGLGARVVLHHHAFLLQPDTPDEGIDIATYIRVQTGREPAEMFGRVEAVATESGIALDLSKQPRTYSTENYLASGVVVLESAADRIKGNNSRGMHPRRPADSERLDEWRRLLASGQVPSRAALARRMGVSRARVTQALGRMSLRPARPRREPW